ncbi:MAG: phospholipid-binding protein MlaC [Kiloniellales bacterium]
MMAETSGQRCRNTADAIGTTTLPGGPTVSRRRLLVASGLLAGTLVAAVLPLRRARGQSGPGAFLQELGERAVAMLSDPALPDPSRAEKFQALMNESFDLPTIGRFILGRYWRQASEAQQAEFLETFKRVMAARFAPYFTGTSKDSFNILGPAAGAGGDRQAIRSKIRLEGGQIADVDWHLVERDGSFKIVDVVTEGVSMGLTLRSEYGSVLSRHGGDIDALIDLLRQKVNA